MTKRQQGLPHWVTRTMHTKARLLERYGVRMEFKALVHLRHCIHHELEQKGKTVVETTIDGKRALIVKCVRPFKTDGTAYLVSWDGHEFAVVYSPETESLATALPAYVVEQLKNELLAAKAVSEGHR